MAVYLDEGGAVFNVKAYGAAGNFKPGINLPNDTPAFEAALSDALAAGGVVLVPAGTYRITGTLGLGARTPPPMPEPGYVNESGVTWVGDAGLRYGNQTLIYADLATPGPAFLVQAPGTTVRGISLANYLGSQATIGIDVRGHWACEFDTVAVQGFPQCQFRCGAPNPQVVPARGSFFGRWRNCTIQGVGRPASATGAMDGGRGIYSTGNFNNCIIDGCFFGAGDRQYWEPILIENTEEAGVTSTGSVIQNCDFGGGVRAGSRHSITLGAGCQGFSVINNRLESFGQRFLRHVAGAQGLWVSGNQLTGGDPPHSEFDKPAEMMIRVEGSDVEVGPNHIAQADAGVYLETTSNRVVVHPQHIGAGVTTPVFNASTGSVTVLSHASPGLEFSSDVVLGAPDRFLRGRRAGGAVERLAGIGSGDVVYLGALDAITRTVVRAGGADHLTLEPGKLGVFGTAPATRPTYTISGSAAARRALNSSTGTAAEVRETLATLISDLKAYGLLG